MLDGEYAPATCNASQAPSSTATSTACTGADRLATDRLGATLPAYKLRSARPWSGARADGALRGIDISVMSTVRRQLEAFEERFLAQLAPLREQQREAMASKAALARLEERLAAVDNAQPRMERRLAELTGNFNGLSEEMQAQIRRLDAVDERSCGWRRNVEEELRSRFAALEQQLQSSRGEKEWQKGFDRRVTLLEAEFTERSTLMDDMQESLETTCVRLANLEALAMPTSEEQEENPIVFLEAKVNEMAERITAAANDAQDAHARVAAQEQQQKTLRTIVELREEGSREVEGACAAVRQAVGEVRERLQRAECQLEFLQEAREAVDAETGLAAQVSALIAQLKDVVPHVLQHKEDFEKVFETLEGHKGMIDETAEEGRRAKQEVKDAQRDVARVVEMAEGVKSATDELAQAVKTLKSNVKAGEDSNVPSTDVSTCLCDIDARLEALGGSVGANDQALQREKHLLVVERALALRENHKAEMTASESLIGRLHELVSRIEAMDDSGEDSFESAVETATPSQ